MSARAVSPRLHLGLRLGALVLLAATLQLAGVSQITVLGSTADLSPLVIVSVGLLCGSIPGALAGWGIGLFIDTALLGTLGVSSLVYVTVGYLAGRVRETAHPSNDLVPLLAGALATAVAQLEYSTLYFMLGIDAPVSFVLLRQILVTIFLNAILALPVYSLVRQALAPALPDRGRTQRRSRRSAVRRGLSPLQGGEAR